MWECGNVEMGKWANVEMGECGNVDVVVDGAFRSVFMVHTSVTTFTFR